MTNARNSQQRDSEQQTTLSGGMGSSLNSSILLQDNRAMPTPDTIASIRSKGLNIPALVEESTLSATARETDINVGAGPLTTGNGGAAPQILHSLGVQSAKLAIELPPTPPHGSARQGSVTSVGEIASAGGVTAPIPSAPKLQDPNNVMSWFNFNDQNGVGNGKSGMAVSQMYASQKLAAGTSRKMTAASLLPWGASQSLQLLPNLTPGLLSLFRRCSSLRAQDRPTLMVCPNTVSTTTTRCPSFVCRHTTTTAFCDPSHHSHSQELSRALSTRESALAAIIGTPVD